MIDPHRRRVLIAEDDPCIRRMLAVSLRTHGYQTAEACNGEEALAAMRAGVTDLVLLDLMMPKMTGFQVLAARNLDALQALVKTTLAATAER